MISIIIPVYNAEKYLERCIKSVLDSTYGNFEVLLINDGSSDRSLEICRNYSDRDSRIRTFMDISKFSNLFSFPRHISRPNVCIYHFP